MLEIGRVCMKIAGRDSGKKAVVIDVLDNTYVLLDGEVRRRKCNIHHLEPMAEIVQIEKNASHAEVLKALDIPQRKTKVRTKEKTPRAKHLRKKKTYAEAKKEKKPQEKAGVKKA